MRKDRKYILVPVDFQKPSKDAAQNALKFAKQLKSELYLLNVIDAPGFMGKFFESGNLLVKVTDQAKEELQKFSQELSAGAPGIKIHTRVDRGKRYERILAIAKEIDARMIIMGENHQGDEAQKDLGSTLYHVTLKSPVPVLTLKGNDPQFPKDIVVPIDLAQETRKQLYSAMVYGMNYGATIHLVSSLVPGVKVRQSLIYKKLRNVKQTLEQNGVKTELEIYRKGSKPSYELILDYAEKIDACMILIMTHKEGYNYDNYIGAFAHHVINRSPVSVLSLTASAIEYSIKEVMKTIVDPIGIFSKK